jgi:hypothetical protein
MGISCDGGPLGVLKIWSSLSDSPYGKIASIFCRTRALEGDRGDVVVIIAQRGAPKTPIALYSTL